MDRCLDKSVLSRSWQRWKWAIKYRLGRREYVPDFEALVSRPHRHHLLDALDAFGSWRSALEVGCGKGANLYLLARRNRGLRLAGVDVNPLAIEQAGAELAQRDVREVHLEVADATNVKAVADGSFDVVFSDAVLMYVPPADISAAMSEMLRIARLGVVVSTWHRDSRPEEEPCWYDEGTWVYDYRRLFKEQYGTLEILPYPPGTWQDARWCRYGCLVRLVLNRKD